MRKLLSTLSSTLQGGGRGGILLLLLVASVSAIYASDTKVDGIWYDFDSSTKTASVTYRGSSYSSYEGEYSGSVTIPETVTYIGITYSVTSIGKTAFCDCSSLTSVTIPNSVTSIGKSAFNGCSSLTSVTIPNSVTSIGSYAFRDCSSLTSVTIGESVTSIGEGAFRYCSSLTSVTIPNSVTSIGEFAFDCCNSLTKTNYTGDIAGWCNIKFGNSSANPMYCSHNFYINDQEIKDLVIPNNVTRIGSYAFYHCDSLTSVTIPNSVTSIGDNAFGYCYYLKSVTINSDAIVSKAYSNASNISHIFGSQVTEYIIGNKVKGIGFCAFYGCSHLTSITIGESVTSIGDYTFRGCTSLKSVTIPNSVTSIGGYAFEDCSKLTKTNYTGDIAGWCNIKFGNNYANPMYYSHNFYINDQEIKDLVIPNSVTSIGDYAFGYCSKLTSVTIPNSVTSIGDYAFEDCSKLTKTNYTGDIAGWCNIKFGNNYANPMYYSHNFYINDQEIKDLVIPNSVTSIGDDAFNGCSSLTSVTIPNSVTSIGSYAFNGCSSLTSVTIPNSVTSIGSYAFRDCSKLTKTNFTGDIAGWCNIKFGNNYANPMYYSHNFYINDQEIKDLVIPNSVTSIGDDAFNGCSSLTSVTIPNSVTSIGDYAFNGCSSLTSVTIPNSVTSIGDYAFRGCTSLKSVTIPNSVTSIGDGVFSGCSSLTSVTIPNSVTSIGDYAFSGCSSLASITIPNSVTSIGGDAFYGCSSLTSVTINSDAIVSKAYSDASNISHIFGSQVTEYIIGDEVKSIGNGAFSWCSSLTSVTIGESVRSIGKSAFYECSKLASMTCEAITPPSFINSSYTFYGVSKSIPVYVPCGCVEAYNTAGAWGNFTNIQEPLMEYSVEVDANDTIMGTAKVDYNTFCEGNQISATPNIGYHFVQWSDGVTDNPRTLELTQDTILIAEFAQSFSGQCGDSLYWELIDIILHITGSGAMYDYTPDSIPWKLLVSSIKELTIAEDVTSIDGEAFSSCSALDSVVWNAKKCADFARKENAPFYDIRSQIKSFTFGEAVEHIPASLCSEMDKLTSVTIPNSVKTIGTSAFEGCARLGKISLGTGLEEIAANAFAGCTRLYDIYTYATYPPFAEESSFANYNAYLYIPCESKRDYTMDPVWSKFQNIECLSDEPITGVENIDTPSQATTNCEKIIRNGQLIIIRDGVEYNAMGQEM